MLLGKIHGEEIRGGPGSSRLASLVNSKSFKDSLVCGVPGINLDGSTRRSIRFSYIEASNKDWLAWSMIWRYRNRVDILRL